MSQQVVPRPVPNEILALLQEHLGASAEAAAHISRNGIVAFFGAASFTEFSSKEEKPIQVRFGWDGKLTSLALGYVAQLQFTSSVQKACGGERGWRWARLLDWLAPRDPTLAGERCTRIIVVLPGPSLLYVNHHSSDGYSLFEAPSELPP